ncbi:PREDICTED: growth arrest and DNA damage-inducible protein GADD45 gamma [Pygoscelis adeliae]|uniref:growth arrest and DNA damage-inducible protein GADD45 gamma n=1 Tax=Pygoscelis adeliae TaxID=9238 RepID=UPI0004F50D04|nr:PREDICTED: growth arrest and DNA damage-inducible protein GADD45 gamma [Pygoscelis adeliae]
MSAELTPSKRGLDLGQAQLSFLHLLFCIGGLVLMPWFEISWIRCLCVLATDEEDEGDIALQIHFTLIQAFCCENDIDIVRVNDVAKLAAIVGPSEESGEPRDLHCILITNPNEDGWKDPALEKLNLFCEESRNVNDWVPTITLPE